jgi:uncharacterized protein
VRVRVAVFVCIVQSILFFAQAAVYETWIRLWGPPGPAALPALRVCLGILSISFVVASLLAFRSFNPLVRGFYRFAAVWLGLLNFFLCAACLSWVVYGLAWLAGSPNTGRSVVAAFFALAIVMTIYGTFNASRVRIKSLWVRLPNLPDSWRGKRAALVSDLHLGHVHNRRFSRKIVAMVARENPEIVFITGDFYDGTRIDLEGVAEPWSHLSPSLGVYFVAGNHEEFRRNMDFIDGVRSAGIRVLQNEKVVAGGMQIVGVNHHSTANPRHFASILREVALDRNSPSILLSHSPHLLEIPERAGISLQLSGHTHRGQFLPWRWVVDRIFGPFAYGLHQFGNMMVCTSSGAGTWGPPMRVGTDSEIVLIRFE